MEPAELREIAVDCEVFQVLLELLPSDFPRGKAGMKIIEMNNICLLLFVHWCLKVLSKRVSKLLRRLELINANVETARNDLSIVYETFHRK